MDFSSIKIIQDNYLHDIISSENNTKVLLGVPNDTDLSTKQGWIHVPLPYRSLLASLSDSRSVSTSPSLTGPFTFLMIVRLLSSMNSTRTCEESRHNDIRIKVKPYICLTGKI